MTKNAVLMKQGVEAAGNRKQVNFRIPVPMQEQLSMMAAERGEDMTAVIVDVLERGLSREAVREFVMLSSKRFAEIQTDNHVLSDVLSDITDQLKLISGRLESLELAAKNKE